VENGELSKELDEGSLSEGVVDGGVEGEGRSELGEVLDPSSLVEGEEREEKRVSSRERRGRRRDEGETKRNERWKRKDRKSGRRKEEKE